MEFESQRARSCLFCQEETFLLPSEIEVKKEAGVDDLLPDTQSCGDLPSIAKVQLKPIFIVRKLLDIPEEKCAEYLQHNEGRNSPSSWFAVCQSCISSVEDGYKIYREIKQLEHNFETIKVKLKRLLLTSSKRGDCDGSDSDNRIQRRTRRSKELEKERDFVHADIRKFVTDQDTTEVHQQQTNGKVELLRCKAANIIVTHSQSSGEDSDDGAGDGNDKDTEWEPESDGGESADQPILKQEQESDDDNDEDNSSSRIQKRKSVCRRRAEQRKPNITISAETNSPVQDNDKPIVRRPVKTLWLHRCKLCVAYFRDGKVIDAHNALHSKNGGVPCTQCGWLCTTARSLEYHCVKHHNKSRRPKEWWRPPRKNVIPKYEYKPKDETEVIPFYCDYCHMIFITKVKILRHIEIHHSDIKYLPCSLCDSTFPTKQILDLHLEEEHQTSLSETKKEISTEESQICEHCSESFPSRMKRDYHIAKVHKDILLTCKICGHKARKYCKFAAHQHMKHPLGTEQIFLCEYCPKSYKVKLYLNLHMKNHHYDKLGLDETLMCKECNVKFLKPSGLKQHLNFGHRKPKVGHCCKHCGKVLSTARDLKRHLSLHSAPVVQRKRKSCRKKSKSMATLSSTTSSPVKKGDCYGSDCNRMLRRTRKSNVLENDFDRADNQKFVSKDNDHVVGGDEDTTEDPQHQTNEKASNVIAIVSSGDDSDDKVDDANDTEWQPVSDGGESESDICAPALKQDGHEGNEKGNSSPRIRKKAFNRKIRAKRLKQNTATAVSADTSTPRSLTQTQGNDNDKPIIRKPVKTLYFIRCKLCVAYFKDRKVVDEHNALHSRNEGIPCQQCGWLCSSERTLLNHCVKQHNKVRPPQAPWRPARKNVVPKFKYKAHEEIPYYCDHCHMIFKVKSLLLRHIESYHASMAYLPCNFCDSTFPTKQILELHCKDEHPQSEDRDKASLETDAKDPQDQTCEFCTLSYPSKLKHDLHIAKVHKDMLLTCKICGYKAVNYRYFIRHKRGVHQEGKEQFVCEHCARSFSEKGYLNRHMKLAHYNELGIDEPLTCKECSVQFLSPSALQGHINNVHKKIKEHCCEHCGKAFSRLAELTQHILLHTAPREEQYKKGPFFCQLCQAKFNVRQALYYHMKKHHTDQYAFKCDYCGTGYITQNTLLQHLRNCKEKDKTK